MRREWYKKRRELIEEIERTQVSADEVAIWYLGQCGFAIKGKKVILIDVVFNDILDEEGNSLRCYEPPFSADEVCVDYVLCTHEHIDHMAKDTIMRLHDSSQKTIFIVPGVCKEQMLQWGLSSERIIEMDASESIELEDVKIGAISTAHPVHKMDANGRAWSLAYDIEVNGIHLLHMGDTYITDELLDALKSIDTPDVLMVPINGGDYYRERNDIIGNMSAREAAVFSTEITADLTIPMHYDMIRGNTCNPLRFVESIWERDTSRKFALPALGERIIYIR